MVYCVGLTGSIASGKSTLLQYFAELGAEVISADTVSRKLTAKDEPAYHEILKHFGPEAQLADGTLNRPFLRQIIFSNHNERLWLESVLHPLIRQEIRLQVTQSTKVYCIIEIPLLVDTQHYPYLNQILVITAPQEIQVNRVMTRDGSTKEEALAILAIQPKLDQRLEFANDVLVNDMSMDELKQAVLRLHTKYLHEVKRIQANS
ncbi:MAG: dephospho-CoA kinase [Legionella sp.]|nr:MAG: dephospho-CoA kinase [Legionella sp.]